MKNKTKPDAQGGRKPYVKPEVRKVTLAPEEAVLGNCKVSAATTGPSVNCNYLSLNCNAQGS